MSLVGAASRRPRLHLRNSMLVAIPSCSRKRRWQHMFGRGPWGYHRFCAAPLLSDVAGQGRARNEAASFKERVRKDVQRSSLAE
jgi:hypothetical protein